jgi:hypothetical protein
MGKNNYTSPYQNYYKFYFEVNIHINNRDLNGARQDKDEDDQASEGGKSALFCCEVSACADTTPNTVRTTAAEQINSSGMQNKKSAYQPGI